jgi:hypothetical protein
MAARAARAAEAAKEVTEVAEEAADAAARAAEAAKEVAEAHVTLMGGTIQVKVEDDPNGLRPHEPGAKLDAGKPDAGLLLDFGNALAAVAEVATKGAEKYSRGGWLEVDDACNRYTAAMMRHMLKTKTDGPTYNEDGVNWDHDAQIAWNALARLEIKLRRLKDGK